MSRIDELIAEHCPRGVEIRDLGDVIHLNFGTRITKLKDNGTRFPVYGGGGESFRTDAFNRENEFVISRFAMSANCVRKVEGKFWMLDSGFTFDPSTPDVLKEYVAYWLFNNQASIYACSSQGAQKNLKTSEFKRFRIPVPPLEVQRAIVEVLDTFSKLEAELEAELEARKQQYEHYHHQLVSKNRFESLSWKPLSEIATIRTGSKPDLIAEDGSFPYVNAGTEPSGFTIDSNACGDAVTIPSRGQGGAGHIGYQASDFWCGPLCYRVASKSSDFANRFIYYYLKNIQDEIIALRKIGSIPAVNKSDLGTVLIPCVSPNEQRRIVEILDKFDALVNDLSVGLPAELVARRQQYEYYRDKLLSFREIG